MPDDSTRGVFLVEIPASASAPHLADGTYYGRGDTTRTRLTDAEIGRLHARRTTRRLTAEQVYERARRHARRRSDLAHFYAIALPLASPPDLLTAHLDNRSDVRARVQTEWQCVPKANDVGCTYSYLSETAPTPSGLSMRSPAYGASDEEFAAMSDPGAAQMNLEVHDDGTVEFFCGNLSKIGTDGAEWLLTIRGLVWAESVLRSACRLAGDVGYAGPWLIVLGIDRIGGLADRHHWDDWSEGFRPVWPPAEDPYLESAECWTVELLERPHEVVRRLTRRLLRGLGTQEHHASFFVRA